MTRSFARRDDVDQTFQIDSGSQEAIDVWSGQGKVQVKTTPAQLINYDFVNQ